MKQEERAFRSRICGSTLKSHGAVRRTSDVEDLGKFSERFAELTICESVDPIAATEITMHARNTVKPKICVSSSRNWIHAGRIEREEVPFDVP